MPAQKGSLIEYMITTHEISQRQACKAVSLPQSSGRYKHKPKNDVSLISELQLLVDKHPSIGSGKVITGSEEKVLTTIINVFTGYTQI